MKELREWRTISALCGERNRVWFDCNMAEYKESGKRQGWKNNLEPKHE